MASFLYTLIISPLYTLIECIYTFFFKVTYDVGFSIIGVSIGITILCLPLYAVAEHWQQIERDKEKSMEKQLSRIKATFSGDERYMMTTAYFKECHYSQLMSLRSSFGLLIQVPFFIAAYGFLSQLETTSSFFFIRNLSQQDSLFKIGNFTVNVLPIAMTLINIIAGAVYTKGFKWKDKATIYGMALIFLVILYKSPSGLVLYWTMNNVFSLVKNIFYKLKNPLKSFYVMCCGLLVPATIFVFAKAHTKLPNKLIFLGVVILIYMIPLLIKAVNWLLEKKLDFISENTRSRNTIFILSCVILAILTGFVIPSTLISSSPIEFTDLGTISNPQSYINLTFIKAAGTFIFWGMCIYFLFGKKVQAVFASLLCAVSFGAIVNTYVFMMNYGDISNALKFLQCDDFGGKSLSSVINMIILAAILVFVPFAIKIREGKIISSFLSIILLSVTVISVSNAISINREYRDYKLNFAENEASNIEPLFTLSKNKQNVVLLYLDMAQGQFVPEMVKEKPELLDIFEGFTFYNNTLSYNGHTIMGSPGVYGGYEYTPLEMNRRDSVPLVEKHNEALTLLPRIFNEQLGYSAVLTDPSWPNYKQYCDLSFLNKYPEIKGYKTCGKYYSLWSKEYKENSNVEIPENSSELLNRNMIFFSIFRASPVILRKLIYKNGTYWNTNADAENGKAALDNYSALYYLPKLTQIKETENGSYLSFINQLTHENDVMIFQAPDYAPVANAESLGNSKFNGNIGYSTQMAAFDLIGKWFSYLKENGIYDNTRIVIVSDHGGSGYEDDFEPNMELDNSISGGQYVGRGHYHCLLMFKDFNAKGKMALDHETFMTNADTASMLLRDMSSSPLKNPFTGKEMPYDTENLKKDGVYISAADTHQPGNNGKYTFSIKPTEWWHVKDNIFRSSNWSQKNPFAAEENKGGETK